MSSSRPMTRTRRGSSVRIPQAPGELDHSTRLRATKFPDFHSAYAARCKELGIKPHPKVVEAMDVPEGEDARDIEFLVLAGIHLSRRDVKALCWSLSCHRTLLHLDLSSIPLGDVGVAEVSSLLRPRTCPLQELILHDCGMGEPGALKLAKRVKASQLRILDISSNTLTAKVATSIAELLRQPKCSLHKLCLNATRISSSGGLALVKALHDNQSLRYLGLRHCGLNFHVGGALLGALEANRHILFVQVEHNTIGSSQMRRIADLLQRNRCVIPDDEVLAASYARPNTGAHNPKAKRPARSYRNAADTKSWLDGGATFVAGGRDSKHSGGNTSSGTGSVRSFRTGTYTSSTVRRVDSGDGMPTSASLCDLEAIAGSHSSDELTDRGSLATTTSPDSPAPSPPLPNHAPDAAGSLARAEVESGAAGSANGNAGAAPSPGTSTSRHSSDGGASAHGQGGPRRESSPSASQAAVQALPAVPTPVFVPGVDDDEAFVSLLEEVTWFAALPVPPPPRPLPLPQLSASAADGAAVPTSPPVAGGAMVATAVSHRSSDLHTPQTQVVARRPPVVDLGAQLGWSPGVMLRLRSRLRAASYAVGGVDWPALFHHYDRNNDGRLQFEEFRSALRRDAKIPPSALSNAELLRLFCLVDRDGSGVIDLREFLAWLQHDDAPPAHTGHQNGIATSHASPTGPHSMQPTVASALRAKAVVPVDPSVPDSADYAAAAADTVMWDPAVVSRLRYALRGAAYTVGGVSWPKLFRHHDRNNNGVIELDEFRSAIRRSARISPAALPEGDVLRLFCLADVDGSGAVVVDEFVEWAEQPTDPSRLRAAAAAAAGRVAEHDTSPRSASPRASSGIGGPAARPQALPTPQGGARHTFTSTVQPDSVGSGGRSVRGVGMGMGMGDFGSNGNMLSPLPAVHTLNPAARATPPDNVFLASEVVRPEPPVPQRPVRAGAPTAGDVHPPGDVARTSPPAPVTSRVATRVHDLQSKVAALTHKLQHATAEANQNALQASAARDALHYSQMREAGATQTVHALRAHAAGVLPPSMQPPPPAVDSPTASPSTAQVSPPVSPRARLPDDASPSPRAGPYYQNFIARRRHGELEAQREQATRDAEVQAAMAASWQRHSPRRGDATPEALRQAALASAQAAVIATAATRPSDDGVPVATVVASAVRYDRPVASPTQPVDRRVKLSDAERGAGLAASVSRLATRAPIVALPHTHTAAAGRDEYAPTQEEALRLRQMALANQVHELTTELARSRAEAAELQAIAEENRRLRAQLRAPTTEPAPQQRSSSPASSAQTSSHDSPSQPPSPRSSSLRLAVSTRPSGAQPQPSPTAVYTPVPVESGVLGARPRRAVSAGKAGPKPVVTPLQRRVASPRRVVNVVGRSPGRQVRDGDMNAVKVRKRRAESPNGQEPWK